jgi:prepilin-type N-terminal cleavage/methylation domain-containing protein
VPTITLNNHLRENMPTRTRKSESGFTLIEMVIAMLLMLVGLLALASAVGYALMVSNKGRNITNSKLLVVSVLEQMETVRNTRRLTFGQISNVGGVDNTGATREFNGFPTDFRPVTNSVGPDGILGTDDDLVVPGPDGVYGTSDDRTDQTLASPAGYSRQIIITRLSSELKRIQVTLRYPGNTGDVQTRVGVSYLNNDARGNFLP